MDQLKCLRVFVQVVADGSFAGAARHLDIAPAVATRALAELEAHLGARLLARSTRALSLTDEGDTLLSYGQRLLDTTAELDSELSGKLSGPSGWVRLAVSPVLAETVIAPSLPSLYEAFPQLQVEVLADDRMSDMAREGVDIAIRTGSPQGDNLVARQIAEHGRQLCASPTYLRRFGTPQHPDELAAHRLITSSASPGLNRWPWDPRAQQPAGAFYLAKGHTRSDNSALTMALALQGAGIARLNDLLTRAHFASGALVPVLDTWFDRSRVPIYAVMLPERHRLPKVRACTDHWARWLSGEVPAGLVPA